MSMPSINNSSCQCECLRKVDFAIQSTKMSFPNFKPSTANNTGIPKGLQLKNYVARLATCCYKN